MRRPGIFPVGHGIRQRLGVVRRQTHCRGVGHDVVGRRADLFVEFVVAVWNIVGICCHSLYFLAFYVDLLILLPLTFCKMPGMNWLHGFPRRETRSSGEVSSAGISASSGAGDTNCAAGETNLAAGRAELVAGEANPPTGETNPGTGILDGAAVNVAGRTGEIERSAR